MVPPERHICGLLIRDHKLNHYDRRIDFRHTTGAYVLISLLGRLKPAWMTTPAENFSRPPAGKHAAVLVVDWSDLQASLFRASQQ